MAGSLSWMSIMKTPPIDHVIAEIRAVRDEHAARFGYDVEAIFKAMTHSYPAEIKCDADGRFVVTFPDFGWGATDGATLEEALAEARDLLRELIATTVREGEALPARSRASKRCPLVFPPAQTALCVGPRPDRVGAARTKA